MPHRPFALDRDSVILPKGTRVVLRQPVEGTDGFVHRAGSLGTVNEVCLHTYTVKTPSGRTLEVQRDQITSQRDDLLESLGRRQWEFSELREEVIYSAIVGSQAWGLADEYSDRDVRGCFLAPFEVISSLWDSPGDVQSASGDEAYWEVGKLVVQGLKGDANTLETLWSPLRLKATHLGEELIRHRRMFVSMNVLGSFGRYAQSQFKKIERSLKRNEAVEELLEAIEKGRITDREQAGALLEHSGVARHLEEARQEVDAVARSLNGRGLLPGADFQSLLEAVVAGRSRELRPASFRPKNAYNLLRLLHSCLQWLRTGEPLIGVAGELRERLLEIKKQQVPIRETLQWAKDVSREIDEASHAADLPELPDFERADEFLRLCRREAARRQLAFSGGGEDALRGGDPSRTARDPYQADVIPVALPEDVDLPPLRRFVARYLEPRSDRFVPILWVALTGAHAYGFTSPDSDLDLKGVFTAPAAKFLGLGKPPGSVDFLADWEGREYDLTLNELGQVANLVLQGNGNIIERFLGPYPLVSTVAGREFRELVRGALSRRVVGHYRGFFQGMQREHHVEARQGRRCAKTLLYAYRVALTGVHLLRTGEVITNLSLVADQYGYADRVKPLIHRKQVAEYAVLDEGECRAAIEDWERLEADLSAALDASTLPAEAPNRPDFERFLIDQRMQVDGWISGRRAAKIDREIAEDEQEER